MEENRGQGVISNKKLEEMKWYRCIRKAVWPREAKTQQSDVWSGEPKSVAKERDSQRDIRRMFKMLREVWMNIGVEKLDMHEGTTIKVLLDSGTIGMFMDKRMAARHGFKLQKPERPIAVRNVDRTNNSKGVIIHQVEVNIYDKGHVERMRMDVCDLGKMEIILGIPWLVAHNPEINQEMRKVKMTRYPLLCGRVKLKEEERKKKKKRVATLEEEKIVRWAIDDKEDQERKDEIEENHWKIEEMVPKRFLKWKKVFRKVELERMPTKKVWDHAIDLKKTFVL